MPEEKGSKRPDGPSQESAPSGHEVPLTPKEKLIIKEGDEEFRELVAAGKVKPAPPAQSEGTRP